MLKPAGLEASKDVLSTGYLKDPTISTWDNDAGKKEWLAFMDKYYPDGDKNSSFTVYGYTVAQTLLADAQAGRRQPHARERDEAGPKPEELTHPMLLPGITINTSDMDFYPIEQMQMRSSTASARSCSARSSTGAAREADPRSGSSGDPERHMR